MLPTELQVICDLISDVRRKHVTTVNMMSVRSKHRDGNFVFIITVQSYLGLEVFFVKSSPRAFAVKIKDQVSKQTRKEQKMEQRM